jgi:hypothetical protein
MASLIKKNKLFQKSGILILILVLIFGPILPFQKAEASTGYPVPHIVSISAITLSSGNFLPLAQTAYTAATSTEAYVQTYMTKAGTWSGLSVYFRTANASGSTTFTVRKNGADTALAVTIPQSSTGLYQDLSNTVSVSVGDLMSIGVTTSAGTAASVPSITTLFEATSGDSVQYNMSLDPNGFASGTQPRYFRVAGLLTPNAGTEAGNQSLVQHAGAITAIAAYVSANTRTTTTTFRSRINSANGTVTFGVPASPSGTGLFVDTAHSDSVAAGDLINGTYTWTSGSNSLTVRNIQLTIVSTNPREITFIGGNNLSKNASTGSAWNFAAGLLLNSGASETIGRSYPITPGVMSGLAYYSSANTATQTLTYQLRKNTANANQSVAVTGTGWVQDVTNTDSFSATDFSSMNGSRSVAGSGSTTMQNTSMKYTMTLISPTYNQSAYRLFNNANSADVGSALAAQDTAGTLAAAGDSFRLRMLINVSTNRLDASGQTFKLQYVGKGAGTCASPSGGTPSSYTDVTGSTLIAYNDNASPADAAALTANASDPTNGGNTIVNQTYEEANNFTNSQAAILSGQDGKWDFSLKDNGAATGTAYCLRAVQSDGTVLGTYTSYPQITTSAVTQSITFSISDNSIGFGTLTTGATRYATGDTTGTTSETVAHTLSVNTNATSGYSLTVKGATLTNGSFTITSCGASCTPTAGTEQFGLRVTASGGTGAVSSPYNHASNYAYQGSSTTSSEIGAATSGDGATTTYSVRYVGNIAPTTEAGSYSGAYTYTVTPSF